MSQGAGGILQRIRKASADAPCPCGSGVRVKYCDHRRFLRRWQGDQAEVGTRPDLALPTPEKPRRKQRTSQARSSMVQASSQQ